MNREEAINSLAYLKRYFSGGGVIDRELNKAINMAIRALQDRPTGEWIRWVVDIEDETGVSYIPHAKCSNCGNEQDSYITQFINFCPNCGADMREEKKDE